MKARDRIERQPTATLRAQKVGRGRAPQRLLELLGRAVLPPAGPVERLERLEVFAREDRAFARSLTRKPAGKSDDKTKGEKVP